MDKFNKVVFQTDYSLAISYNCKTVFHNDNMDIHLDVPIGDGTLLIAPYERIKRFSPTTVTVDDSIIFAITISEPGCSMSDYLINLTNKPIAFIVTGDNGTATFTFEPITVEQLLNNNDVIKHIEKDDEYGDSFYLIVDDDVQTITDTTILNNGIFKAINVNAFFNK